MTLSSISIKWFIDNDDNNAFIAIDIWDIQL